MKVMAIISALVLVASCFFPWVFIETKNIEVTGIISAGTNFGKPALLHFVLTGMILLFLFIGQGWSQKVAVFFAAFNIAWAVRNFSIISACQMGDCPTKQPAIYLIIPATVLLLLAVLFWKKKF